MKSFSNILLKQTALNIYPIQDESENLNGIKMQFMPISEDFVYQTSDNKVVKKFPEVLSKEGFDFDIKSLILFTSALTNAVSTYLYSLRKPYNKGELYLKVKSSFNKDMFLKIHVSKHFFREGNKGRYKIDLSFIVNDPDFGEYELITISFTKKDVLILLSILKDIVSSYFRTKVYFIEGEKIDLNTNESLGTYNFPVAKIDNALVIGDTWMHGQEIFNLMYVTEKVLFGLHIENNLDHLNIFYRQVSFVNQDGILYLYLTKMNKNHEIDPLKTSDGTPYKIKIPVSAVFVSILYLYLSVQIFRHADIEAEEDGVEIIDRNDPFLNVKGVKYHLSLKESFLGINITKVMDRYNLFLIGKVKDAYFERAETLPENIIEFFRIDLKNQWEKIIKGMSIAYTKEYENYDREFNLIRFFVVNKTHEGKIKYEFSIQSNKGNKALAVLSIKKSRIQGDREIELGRFRQPMFEKYVYQFLIMVLAMAEFIPSISYTKRINKKELSKYKYLSMKKVVELTKNEYVDYGIQKQDGETFLGILSGQNNMFVKLDEQDRYLLNQSAYYRITRGKWLPFVGTHVAIGQDGYLTDTFGEVFLEDPAELYGGLDWAIKFYFGTLV